MGMSRYYRNVFGVPKDGTPPPPPEAVTVTQIPEVSEMTFVTDEPEPVAKVTEDKEPEPIVVKKKLGAKKKK